MLNTITLRFKSNNDSLYSKVCTHYNITQELSIAEKSKITWVNQETDSPIRRVKCFNIFYNHDDMGRIWWVDITIDLSLLYKTDGKPLKSSQLEDLESKVHNLFVQEMQVDFKEYLPDLIGDNLLDRRVSFVEYMLIMDDVDADPLMNLLDRCSFEEAQLDISRYETFRVRSATPAFSIHKLNDSTIRLCIKCEDTAIKSVFKKQSLKYVGPPISVIIDPANVLELYYKQIKKYTKPKVFEELSKERLAKLL